MATGRWAEGEAGGSGVTLGWHMVGQAGALGVPWSVLATQDRGAWGPRMGVLEPQEPLT